MHSFDPKIAERVGVNAAVLYQNIVWWCAKNAANKHNEHDGRFWTYNSVKAWAELFPYLTLKQIRSALDRLEDEGLILSGCYNASAYDRTKWYCPSSQTELPCRANEIAQKGEPIPVSKPDIKPDVKLDICEPDVFEAFNEIAKQAGWPAVQSKSKAREAAAKSRMKECGGYENWLYAIKRAARSDFLSGRATGTTPACFDWLNKPANFSKLMEGNYDNRNDNAPRNGTHSRADRPGAGMAQAFAAVAERLSRHPQESDGGGDGFI